MSKLNALPQDGSPKCLGKTSHSLRICFLDFTRWTPNPDIVQLDDLVLEQILRCLGVSTRSWKLTLFSYTNQDIARPYRLHSF